MQSAGELLEWAQVFGQSLRARRKAPVNGRAGGGRRRAVRYRLAGARQLKAAAWPVDVASVFILPPDGKTLERRLRGARLRTAPRRSWHDAWPRRPTEIEHWVGVRLRHRQSPIWMRASPRLAGDPRRGAPQARSAQTGLDAFVRGVLAGL